MKKERNFYYGKITEKQVKKNIWLEFLLKPDGKEVIKAMEKDDGIKNAHDEWRKITQDEINRDRALRLEIAELDRNTALKHAKRDGVQEGIKEGIEKMILNMYNQKMPIEDIAKYAELSIDEVKNVIKKHEKES